MGGPILMLLGHFERYLRLDRTKRSTQLSVSHSPNMKFAISFLALMSLLNTVTASGVFIMCADGGNLL